jgi:protein-L-isoaspartate(D-aspartate) O-methyltransferase
VVTCAAREVPPALGQQLKEGGRLVVPVGVGTQDLRLIRKTPAGLETTSVCSVRFVPLVEPK